MSRSSSERSPPRLGAKSGAKLLLPDDMAKFFRDFFSKKFQRKHNGLITSHVRKMFFNARGAARSQRGTARERGGWRGGRSMANGAAARLEGGRDEDRKSVV